MEAFLASFFALFSIAAPKSRVRTRSLEMLRRLVRQNELIGFLPLHWIPEDLKAGRLVVLPVEHTPIRRLAGIVTRQGGVMNAGAKLLVDQLRLVGEEINTRQR
jgi:DNA-binding transcriptional LysR family regulator